MIDVNEIFNKERILEKETIAIINYFRTLWVLNLAINASTNKDNATKTFIILGEDYLKRLVIDCQQGNIDIYNQTGNEFLKKIKKNLTELNKTGMTKSILTMEIFKLGNIIVDYLENNLKTIQTTLFLDGLTSEKTAFEILSYYYEKLSNVSTEYSSLLEMLESNKKLERNL